MTFLSKTLLAISAAGFIAGGVIDFGRFNLNPSWTVVLPAGAVFFGLFMISVMMAKEMAAFDAEEACRLERAEPRAPVPERNAAAQSAGASFKERALLNEH